jgi:two-component system, LuxR family, response regulator DctR
VSRTVSVFICDDDAGVRDSLQFLFEQHAHQVRVFADGPALLAALSVETLPRAVILLDVRMDPLSGPQVQAQLCARGLGERYPLIFLSGHGDIPLAVAALSKGAFSFVEKPYADHALVELVDSAMLREAEWHTRAQRRAQLHGLLAGLSERQRALLPLIAAGELNKVIAAELDLAIRSIEVHRAKLFASVGVSSAAELATLVAEMRALGLDPGPKYVRR